MTQKSTEIQNVLELAGRAFSQRLESEPGLSFFDIEAPDFKLPGTRYSDLASFNKSICECQRCSLGKTRTKFVFGVGSPQADILFVGEAPGRDEDLKGEPFVGRAGQLLDKILAAIKLSRQEVFIANILKCRPPNNRDPLPEEAEACIPYLLEQIKLIQPKLICCLGRIAAQILMETKTPLGKMRGRFMDYHGTKLLVTYHPAALLRFPKYKVDVWEDVKLLRREYDRMMGRKPVV